MPKFLEEKLKARYGEDSDIPYKIMNAKGFMHGNKETEKGRAAERKHEDRESKGHEAREKKKKKFKTGAAAQAEALRG